jgi:hypothetical protein
MAGGRANTQTGTIVAGLAEPTFNATTDLTSKRYRLGSFTGD